MAHAIWSGSINFGLVTIPVKLFTAIREKELSFNQLHAKDHGRINYKRVCSVDGKEVPWAEIVKGYEYEDDRYIVLSDEDLKSVSVEATQSIDIVQFVNLDEINPMFFDKPYYLEPEKKGRHAYALLREALAKANKVGLAKVVIRTREYLSALKPQGDALILELMHFADELVPADEFNFEHSDAKVPAAELRMANMLIDSLTSPFKAEAFKDTYRDSVLEMIEDRARGKAPKKAKAVKKAPATVTNLMDVLQQSLRESKARSGGNGRANGKAGQVRAKAAKAKR
jgi:DNA end-binding protein Ku